MPRFLTDRDSTAAHLNAARRHQRLVRRLRQEGFATSIDAPIKALAAAAAAAEDKAFESQAASDEVFAADGDLDDAVRDLFNAAEIHDRQKPDAVVLPTLFPDGGFSDVIDEPLAQEPAIIDALAVKVEKLGATHPLAAHAALLRTAANAVRTALSGQDDAVRAGKLAEAEEELAQGALRRAYEANYLDLRKKLGRVRAERAYPRLRRPSAPAAPDGTPA